MIFWPDLQRKSWDLELQGAQRGKKKYNCLLVFVVRNIAGESSEPALWHHLFEGLSMDFITVGDGLSQMCQLCSEERQSLGLAKALPSLPRSRGGYKELLVKAQSTCREPSKSFWETPRQETKLGLTVGTVAKGPTGAPWAPGWDQFTVKCWFSRGILESCCLQLGKKTLKPNQPYSKECRTEKKNNGVGGESLWCLIPTRGLVLIRIHALLAWSLLLIGARSTNYIIIMLAKVFTRGRKMLFCCNI